LELISKLDIGDFNMTYKLRAHYSASLKSWQQNGLIIAMNFENFYAK
jgi:hypothetical protein